MSVAVSSRALSRLAVYSTYAAFESHPRWLSAHDGKEDAAGAELVPVDVERDGHTVVFGWADPWSGGPTEMACTKA